MFPTDITKIINAIEPDVLFILVFCSQNISSDMFVSSAVTNLFHRQEILLPGANTALKHTLNYVIQQLNTFGKK